MTLQQDFLSQKVDRNKIKVIKDIEEAVDYLDNDRKEKDLCNYLFLRQG